MNKTLNDQSKYFAGINKNMSETRRAVETNDSNKDDEHRGLFGYARGRQAAPQAKMADNTTLTTLGVAASSGEVSPIKWIMNLFNFLFYQTVLLPYWFRLTAFEQPQGVTFSTTLCLPNALVLVQEGDEWKWLSTPPLVTVSIWSKLLDQCHYSLPGPHEQHSHGHIKASYLKNYLYSKADKWQFYVASASYLGYFMTREGTQIQKRYPLLSLDQVPMFHGFVNL